MLQGEHSAILSTFIKLPFVIKVFVLSIFEWPLKTGFTVQDLVNRKFIQDGILRFFLITLKFILVTGLKTSLYLSLNNIYSNLITAFTAFKIQNMLCRVQNMPLLSGQSAYHYRSEVFFILLNHMEAPEPKFCYKGEWFM